MAHGKVSKLSAINPAVDALQTAYLEEDIARLGGCDEMARMTRWLMTTAPVINSTQSLQSLVSAYRYSEKSANQLKTPPTDFRQDCDQFQRLMAEENPYFELRSTEWSWNTVNSLTSRRKGTSLKTVYTFHNKS